MDRLLVALFFVFILPLHPQVQACSDGPIALVTTKISTTMQIKDWGRLVSCIPQGGGSDTYVMTFEDTYYIRIATVYIKNDTSSIYRILQLEK